MDANGPEVLPLSIIVIISYTLLGGYALYQLVKMPRSFSEHPIRKYRKVFYVAAVILAVCRIVWTSLLFSKSSFTSMLMNRLSFALFLTCFSTVLFTWIYFLNIDHHVYFVQNLCFIKYFKMFLIGFNVLLYVGTVISSTMYVYVSRAYPKREMIFYGAATLFIAVLLLVAGCRVRAVTKAAGAARTGRLFLFVTLLCLLMALRSLMLMYYQLTNSYLPDSLFYSLSYYIPELTGVGVQIYLYGSTAEANSNVPGKNDTLLQQDGDDLVQDSQTGFLPSDYAYGHHAEPIMFDSARGVNIRSYLPPGHVMPTQNGIDYDELHSQDSLYVDPHVHGASLYSHQHSPFIARAPAVYLHGRGSTPEVSGGLAARPQVPAFNIRTAQPSMGDHSYHGSVVGGSLTGPTNLQHQQQQLHLQQQHGMDHEQFNDELPRGDFSIRSHAFQPPA